jgi:dihydrolipoamide dehydrogenase
MCLQERGQQMSVETSYDVAIIGAGPGGYVAAIRAAQLGARVALVERAQLGGTCLNRGCIPTKAFVASAQAYRTALRAEEFGFRVRDVEPDYAAMSARSMASVERLRKGVQFLLRKNKVDVIQGRATLKDARNLQVQKGSNTQEITAQHIIVATGSKPMVIPAFGYDGVRVVTSDEMLELQTLPDHIVIIGGGVIGCEFASIFHSLGAKVTIIEALESILPTVERDVARQLASYFRRRGIDILPGTKVETVEKGEAISVQISDGKTIPCDMVLISIGRRPNSAGLGLESVGVEVNSRGEIVVDERMATTVPGIYAIGDVTDCPWKLAHVASRQGIVAAHCIAGQEESMDYRAVPAAIFSSPEVASVGLTTEQAQDAGIDVVASKFPFVASGKAITQGETEGFVKILADRSTRAVVGVHIIGPEAATLISEATVAIQHELSSDQLAGTMHTHPTLPEAIMEAAEGVAGLTIHA